MVDSDFPCKVCTHNAERHYLSITGGYGICLQCATTTDRNYNEDEHWHDFEGDNLKYMELQNKRKELLND